MRSKGFLVEDYPGTVRRVGGVSLSNFVTVNGRGVGEILLEPSLAFITKMSSSSPWPTKAISCRWASRRDLCRPWSH